MCVCVCEMSKRGMEALLAMHEVTGDAAQLDLARDVVALFRRHLLHPAEIRDV